MSTYGTEGRGSWGPRPLRLSTDRQPTSVAGRGHEGCSEGQVPSPDPTSVATSQPLRVRTARYRCPDGSVARLGMSQAGRQSLRYGQDVEGIIFVIWKYPHIADSPCQSSMFSILRPGWEDRRVPRRAGGHCAAARPPTEPGAWSVRYRPHSLHSLLTAPASPQFSLAADGIQTANPDLAPPVHHLRPVFRTVPSVPPVPSRPSRAPSGPR